MKERPILMSAPMVRALLAGRKTQTRRAIRFTEQQRAWLRDPSLYLQRMYGTSPPPNPVAFGTPGLWRIVGPDSPDSVEDNVPCPFGVPGDRLWVRERGWIARSGLAFLPFVSNEHCDERPPTSPDGTPYKPCPSIHMPRWASRILLELTSMRVERLQQINEADAQAEGIVPWADRGGWHTEGGRHYHALDPRESYFSLWEAINGPGSVQANPWVWVMEFRRVAE